MGLASWTYILITFLITWSISFISYFLFKNEKISFDTLNSIYNFGALGPFLGALTSAMMFYGKSGVGKLFSTLKFNIGRPAFNISVSPLLFFLLGLLVYPFLTGHLFSFSTTKTQYNLINNISYVNWLLPFISYSIFEEFGWRGFLLPHLQQNYSALKSTIILTFFWATWHLPFFLWRMHFTPFITFGFFFSIFIGSLIITTTFNLSKGSIISVIFFHFCNNIASAFDKEYIVAIVSTCFVFLATYLVRKYKLQNLSDAERVKNFYLSKE